MRSLVLTAVVTAEHTLTVAVPPDVPPGPRQVVLVIDEQAPQSIPGLPDFRNWPAHEGTLADPSCTFRREDFSGDDGR